MPEASVGRRRRTRGWFVAVLVVAFSSLPVSFAGAQGRGGFGAFGGGRGDGGAPQAARDAAPVDLTGYWVSIVTEDWIERMSPDSPPSGTGGGRGGGRGAAPAPDPSEPCRAYGAAGSMRVPGRLYISWADENTLQVDMDAGSQTRLFHFDASESAPNAPTLQGYSVASWDTGGGGRGRGRGGGGGGGPQWASLRVVTTNLTDGYLLSTRSTYSENTVLTETFIAHSDFGQDYLTVRAEIDDGGVRLTSSTFKKEPDGSKFSPTGCEVVR